MHKKRVLLRDMDRAMVIPKKTYKTKTVFYFIFINTEFMRLDNQQYLNLALMIPFNWSAEFRLVTYAAVLKKAYFNKNTFEPL